MDVLIEPFYLKKGSGWPPLHLGTMLRIYFMQQGFRVAKRQFGSVKFRYPGLAKNYAQMVTLFALAHLWLARNRLMPLLCDVPT